MNKCGTVAVQRSLRTVTVTDLPTPEGAVVYHLILSSGASSGDFESRLHDAVFVLAYSGGTVEHLRYFARRNPNDFGTLGGTSRSALRRPLFPKPYVCKLFFIERTLLKRSDYNAGSSEVKKKITGKDRSGGPQN